MSWDIRWSPIAIHRCQAIHWQDWARVDKAVIHYAETGEGQLVRYESDSEVTVRLYVAPYTARIWLKKSEGVMVIETVYRF